MVPIILTEERIPPMCACGSLAAGAVLLSLGEPEFP